MGALRLSIYAGLHPSNSLVRFEGLSFFHFRWGHGTLYTPFPRYFRSPNEGYVLGQGRLFPIGDRRATILLFIFYGGRVLQVMGKRTNFSVLRPMDLFTFRSTVGSGRLTTLLTIRCGLDTSRR